MLRIKVKFYDIFFSKISLIVLQLILLLSFCHFLGMDSLERVISIFSTIISVIIFIIYIFHGKVSKFNMAFFIYILLVILSSYLGQYSSVELAIKTYYKIFALTCLLDMGFKRDNNTIFSGYIVMALLIIINFYTIIKYPNGMYSSLTYETNWFLGYDNIHICFYFPTMMFVILTNELYGKKVLWLNIIITFMIAFSVYYCFSANTVFVFTMFLVYLLFHNNIDKLKFLNIKNYFLAYIAMFFVIVIARVQNIFYWLVVDVLKKDLTFTGRTKIWDKVINFINKEWLLGYGKETTAIVTEKLGKLAYTHAHNTILDVIYKGGLIGLCAFLYILLCVIKQLYKYKDNKIAKIFSIIMFCFFIMMIFESRQEKVGFYIVLVICNNIGEIINRLKNREVKLK